MKICLSHYFSQFWDCFERHLYPSWKVCSYEDKAQKEYSINLVHPKSQNNRPLPHGEDNFSKKIQKRWFVHFVFFEIPAKYPLSGKSILRFWVHQLNRIFFSSIVFVTTKFPWRIHIFFQTNLKKQILFMSVFVLT